MKPVIRFSRRARTWLCLSVIAAGLLTALDTARAQSGSFVIPGIRAGGGTDFAYWDYFDRPPGAPSNANYNYPNPPALADGFGEDDDGNPTTAFAPRATLTQTGTPNSFITSSGAIYSFSDPLAFEVDYSAPEDSPGEVSNVIFQTQSGGARLNVNVLRLRYENGGQTFEVEPVFKALDDPQSGAFSERIICAFQWDLTGRGVREFQIVFDTPVSMPLWQAQLDAVIGAPFAQELGYLLATRSRPLTRFGRAGAVDKNLPITADGRYFLEGENLNLLGDPENGWVTSGWFYNGATTPGASLPLVFPAQDITVTALFAPQSYGAWRTAMFYHANSLLGTEDDFLDDAISAPEVDHDGDTLDNAGEYAFAGDPYTADDARTRPQMVLVDVGGTAYPALRYRTNGAPEGIGDCVFHVRVSEDGVTWNDNRAEPTTTLFSRVLQSDGSELITERALAPLSSFETVFMDVDWSAAGRQGIRSPLGLALTADAALPTGTRGVAYAVNLGTVGGVEPYQWSVTAGTLPAGLVVDSSGMLTGIPLVSGAQAFTIEVEDAFGQTTSTAFTMLLAPYEITTATLPVARVGGAYHVALSATGGTGPFTWSVSEGVLPDGLSLSAAGVLTGTASAPGQQTFTVLIEDINDLAATREFTLQVFETGIVNDAVLPNGVLNFPYSQQLAGTGGMEPYEWAVSAGALPAGVTLSTTGLLSGTPTASGDFTFTVTLTDDDDFAVAKEFTLSVTDKPQRPSIPAFSFEVATIGADFAHTLSALDYPKTFAVTGLPPGLKLNAATGVIAGRPSLSGVFNVQVRASNAGGTSPWLTVPLIVRALDKNLVGSFSGLVERDAAANQNLGARVELVTTTKGTYTVKVTTGTKAASAKGFLAASAPQVSVPVNGGQLELSINAATGEISGTHGAADVSGWRSTWNALANPADTREGYYSFALDLKTPTTDAANPQGSGFATFTVNLAGALKIVGRSADGAAFTSTSILGPQGEIAFYAPMPKNLGSLHGWLELSEDAQGWFLGNTVSGEPTWVRLADGKSRVYGAGFAELELVAEGGYLGASSKGVALGVPEAGAVQLSFTGAGLDSYGTDPDTGVFGFSDDNKVLPPPASQNATKLSLKFAKGSGAVSGGFVLGKTKVPFYGQVVRLADGSIKAAGHFLLPQLPEAGQKPNATPILSGLFLMTQ